MKYFFYNFLEEDGGEVSEIIRCDEEAMERYYVIDNDAEFIFKTDDGCFFTNKSIHEVPEYYYSFYSFKKLTKCQEMKLKKKIQKGN